MAELNESESTKDTKKTKKEKKMEEKAAKKAAKKAKKNHEADKPDAENDDSDSVSSKIVMVLVTILIIAIWLGIFAVFVKADVGGFGSTVLAPALKDVPVLSKILPDSEPGQFLLDDRCDGDGADVLFAVDCHGHSDYLRLLYEKGYVH